MTAEPCTHWWKIAPPDGPTSAGVCKYCGTVRQFPNFDDGTIWHDAPSGLSEAALLGVSPYRRDRVPARAPLNEIPRTA